MRNLHAVHHRPTVLIAGAGVAGIEALLALRSHLGGTVSVELLSNASEFVYRPTAVAECFGLGDLHRKEIAEIANDQHAAFRMGALASVDPAASVVTTAAGEQLAYDYLLVAIGAEPHSAIDDAVSFGGPGSEQAFKQVLADALSGDVKRVAFVAPIGVAWLMPLYELALLTAWWARRHRVELTLSLMTDEAHPLEAFGAEVGHVVGRLLYESGIEFVGQTTAVRGVDAVVTIPRPDGPYLSGLPHDEEGFILTDRFGAVPGWPRVYAAGDGTTFPIKQGGLAAQQADAAASAIASALGVGVTPKPFHPVLRGLLLTGDLPRFLRKTDDVSEAAVEPLWWPPAKVAGRFLAPYLAHESLTSSALRDREAPAEPEESEQLEADEHDAIDLLLELADANARRGSFSFALRCLQAAEDLAGPLPAERQADRQAWLRQASR